jgi:hypothetical protein
VVTSEAGEVGPCSAWQVGGDHLGGGGVVGDHCHLRGAGEHVDANATVELPLGLCDVRVACADDHVGRRCVLEESECHRGQRLHAAYGEDPLGPGGSCGVEDRGMCCAVVAGRGAADDVRHAGDPGDAHRHESAGKQWEATGGQVGPDGRDRHLSLSADQAGQDLFLKIDQAVTLHLREAAAPVGSGIERIAQIGGEIAGGGSELGLGHLQVLTGESVKLFGVLAHRVEAAALDRGEHLGDRRGDLRVALSRCVRTGWLLDDGERTWDLTLV